MTSTSYSIDTVGKSRARSRKRTIPLDSSVVRRIVGVNSGESSRSRQADPGEC